MTEQDNRLPVPVEEPVFGTRALMTPNQALHVAKQLKKIIDESADGKYVVRVKQSEHPKVEAWATLGGLAGGYYAVPDGPPDPIYKENTDELGNITHTVVGYRSHAVIRREGSTEILGHGYGRCDFTETLTRHDGTTFPRWSRSEPFAVESMAQTRARSKAFRNRFDWVAVLAGYSGTPFEEMEQVASRQAAPPPEPPKKSEFITDEQRRDLFALIDTHIKTRAPEGTDPEQIGELAQNAIADTLTARGLNRTTEVRSGDYLAFQKDAVIAADKLIDETNAADQGTAPDQPSQQGF